ncbi:AraC family transcriptional regulator [Cohnella silvisoli]|uniref:AraC family transcriptional regulator n=1 Tax=Cohnella silvisoli TaxID=2873699 RepID=A0ABV1KT90_9BACL|nr:AraC family transcriptional regulator [Cohnella silvisoli]MCD9022949.1 AraC family transcriptional regulator [Cohnella silvisoli]
MKHKNQQLAGIKMTDATTRWTYDDKIEAVPEFVMLGYDDLRKAYPLNDHTHPDCYEFVFIERGKATWELGGELHETKAGDVFHSRPGEIHSGGFQVIEPCKFWWMIIKAPLADGWFRFTSEESFRFGNALATLSRIVHTGLLPVEPFRQLRREIASEQEFRSVAIRQTIVQLLLIFLKPFPDAHTVSDDLLRQLDKMIGTMRNELHWRPTVQELAASVNVSASHFHRMFQSYTGLSPMSFMERLRQKEAYRLLTESLRPITDIAHSLGYPSSQHFATVFKRFAGATPSQWRARHRAEHRNI